MKSPVSEVREMVRLLRRPYRLRKCQLARRLQAALGVESEVAAVQAIVRLTFSNTRANALVPRTLIADYQDRSATEAAESLNLSLRQYFRYRAEAFDAIAHMTNTVLASNERKVG